MYNNCNLYISYLDVLSDGPIVPAVFHHGQSLGKASPDGFQMLRVKVQSGQRSLIASAEAALHRVTPAQVERLITITDLLSNNGYCEIKDEIQLKYLDDY